MDPLIPASAIQSMGLSIQEDFAGDVTICGITHKAKEWAAMELAVGAKSEHVAWLRINDYNGARAATIHVCDSDAPGAFKVYRQSVL